MKCLLCGNNKLKKISEKVRDSKSHKIVKCANCGLLQIWPLPSINEEKKFYAENRQAKNIKEPTDIKSIKKNFFIDNERRSEMISRIMPKNSAILDVGSGYGFFLQAMINKGFKNIVGVEISEERKNISKKITKAKVLSINLLEKEIPSEKFDCITLFHVLEHIREPIYFLKNIRKKLKNGGILIVEVPNCKDMLLSASEKYRDFYWQLAHLSYFDEKNLKKVINKSGLAVVDIFYAQRYGIENLMNWIVKGAAQIKKPNFKMIDEYDWLEEYYKSYLCKTGKADTIIVIAKNNL